MKILKFFLFSFLLFITGCKSHENAYSFKEEVFDLTSSKDKFRFLEKISAIVSTDGNKISLAEIEVKEGIDLGNDKRYNYILMKDLVKGYNIAIVVLNGGNKYKILENRIVSCFGESDCKPELFNGKWTCDNGLETYKCKKTVTILE